MTAYPIRRLGRLTLGLALGLNASAFAASFNGFDHNGSGTPPLLLRPDSDAARDDFVAAAGGAGAVRLNDFEALASPTVPATLVFGGGLEASFTALSTGPTALTSGTGGFDEFPISGTQHITSLTLKGTNYWTMTFNQPLTAIGFYATDPSDWFGTTNAGAIPSLQVVLTGVAGSITYDLTPGIDPYTVKNASVAFFGVVDTANPFTQLTLVHPTHGLTEDAVGIDNLMAVPVPEPETWVAMLAGLCLLAWRLRARAA